MKLNNTDVLLDDVADSCFIRPLFVFSSEFPNMNYNCMQINLFLSCIACIWNTERKYRYVPTNTELRHLLNTPLSFLSCCAKIYRTYISVGGLIAQILQLKEAFLHLNRTRGTPIEWP